MVFNPPPNRHSFLSASTLSIGVHVLIAALCLLTLQVRPVHVYTLPGTVHGTRIQLAYLPGSAPSPAMHPQKTKPRPAPTRQVTPAPALAAATPAPAALQPPPTPHLTVTEAAPATAGPASATPDSTSGTDSSGSGDVQIALTTFSPSPKPDLSALPHGVQGDVVVDVTIDPTGKVADLAVLHTLGYGIESSVIGTLKTWVFRPATKDGSPIASIQELHFHYGPV
jgi:protein TonB